MSFELHTSDGPRARLQRVFGHDRASCDRVAMVDSNPRCAFEIVDYDSLHAAFRARADQLQISRLRIDEIAGLQPGYSGKALGIAKVRSITLRNIDGFLGALCLKLVAVWIDPDFEFIPLDAAKVLRAARRGNATLRNLGELLAKLRIKMIAIQDDAAFARVKSRLVKRSEANVRSRGHKHERKSGPVTARMFGWPIWCP